MKNILLTFIVYTTIAADQSFIQQARCLLAQYTRPITILELGSSCRYLHDLYRSRNAHIALVSNPLTSDYPITVCRPSKLTIAHLDRLAQCEHIDIALIHEMPVAVPYAQWVGTISNVAEQVIIETYDPELMHVLQQSRHFKPLGVGLYHSHRPKTFLTYSRFTQRYPSMTQYEVLSTFTGKWLIKQEGAPVPWIPGINMVTFIMLGGMNPSDEGIIQQLRSLITTYPRHNDLILGNIVVQGTTLVPIDMNDHRRSASAKKCIKEAIHAFKKPRDAPEAWLQDYYKSLTGH